MKEITQITIPYLSPELAIKARRLSDAINAKKKAAKVERMRAIESRQELKRAEELL